MKSTFFSSLAIASILVLGTAVAPALAEDIDVAIGSAAWDIDQVGVSIAIASATANADTTNIAGLSSFEGWNTDDLLIGSAAFDVDQLAVAGALAYGSGGDATTNATNIAGLVAADVHDVLSNASDTVAVALAGGIDQEAWSVAVGAATANASSLNAAGLVDVSIDVD